MRLQGAISPRVEARLDELLGHPETCPHGNPIDAAIAKRRPAGVRLSEMEAGARATVYRITEEAEEDAGLLSYLEARALKPGAPITILARSESLDSLTLDGPLGRATLGLRPAALVRVLPGRRRPGSVPPRARRRGARPPEARGPLLRSVDARTPQPRPHRPEPDRAAPHRHGPDGAVQLPPRPARRRDVHPAPRGHGRRPQHGRIREGHPRRPALAGPRAGTRVPRWPASRRAGRTRRTARWSACRATPRPPSGSSPTTSPIPATARPRSSTRTARRRRRPSSRHATSVGART